MEALKLQVAWCKLQGDGLLERCDGHRAVELQAKTACLQIRVSAEELGFEEILRDVLVCIQLWTLLGQDLCAGTTISNLVLATARREARVMQELS